MGLRTLVFKVLCLKAAAIRSDSAREEAAVEAARRLEPARVIVRNALGRRNMWRVRSVWVVGTNDDAAESDNLMRRWQDEGW